MDYYYTYMSLLGLRNSNLPPFRDARLRRYKSVKKMVDLISTATKLAPTFPVRIFTLDPFDAEWDDMMPFPVVEHSRYLFVGLALGANMLFYSYNYNVFTANIRFRTLRYFFPVINTALFFFAYAKYKTQITKINLFDEYCWLRAQELVKQNEYLLKHDDLKRFVWWYEDLRETLHKVHRQANEHESSDFADSEVILQDFINRYSDPSSPSPLANSLLVGL